MGGCECELLEKGEQIHSLRDPTGVCGWMDEWNDVYTVGHLFRI